VKGMDPAVTVATGSQHTCVLTAPGDLVCWGQNFSGQLGIGTRESHREPVRVEGAWWQ
jgi:alpha-tubulin suppressor-like RCC1 family protein